MTFVDRGLDYSWGRPDLAQVVAKGYQFVSRYISYDTTGKNITLAERDAILAAGLELALNWQWRGSWDELKGGAPVGREHATEAVRQARDLGYPQGCTIYYSVDFDAAEPGLSGAVSDYLRAAAEVTRAAGYRMGVYGGYRTVRHAFDAELIDDGWQTHSWSLASQHTPGLHSVVVTVGQDSRPRIYDSRAALRQVHNGVKVAGADTDIDERHGVTYLMGGSVTVLPHTTHVQDTGYYCGPASVLTALSVRGIHNVDERTLAGQLGTDQFGTDSSNDVVRVLNHYLGAGFYQAVFIGGTTATASQRERLRSDLVASIDAGYGLVVNVVGTAKALDGRSYSYNGGHYVAVCGYRSGGAEALVTDVAVGRDYWMTTDALAVWIAGRGYATTTEKARTPQEFIVDPNTFPWPYGHVAGHMSVQNARNEYHGGQLPADRPIIAAVQTRLAELGYDLGPSGADGLFGDRTKAAVLAWQRDTGRAEDGTIGADDWLALFTTAAPQQPGEERPPQSDTPEPQQPPPTTPSAVDVAALAEALKPLLLPELINAVKKSIARATITFNAEE